MGPLPPVIVVPQRWEAPCPHGAVVWWVKRATDGTSEPLCPEAHDNQRL